MIILGIDPGSQITGYGVLTRSNSRLEHIDNGGIFTSAKEDFPSRLHCIFAGVKELIQKFSPDVLAIENIFYAKNVKSTIQLGHARGAAIVAGKEFKLPIYEYTPLAIKQAVTGYGRASKEQIQGMVKQLLKLPEVAYYDASDALAVAICHANSSKLEEKIRLSERKK